MNIGIYSNTKRDTDGALAKELAQKIKAAGAVPVHLNSSPKKIYLQDTPASPEVQKCGAVIAIGGDGTMLEAAKITAPSGVPVLGLNRGKLGFLTEITEKQAGKAISALISGKYKIDSRRLLSVTAKTVRGQSKTYLAVNEALIHRDRNMTELDISIDGIFAHRLTGDGVIVSTPSGSTAYSLSCGGPVLAPEINALIVVGVCPHSLHSRPMVVRGSSVITIETRDDDAVLIIDGNRVEDFGGGVLTLTQSKTEAGFIRISDNGFYARLLEKMA